MKKYIRDRAFKAGVIIGMLIALIAAMPVDAQVIITLEKDGVKIGEVTLEGGATDTVRDTVYADPPLYNFLSVGVETVRDTMHVFTVTAQTSADSSKYHFDCGPDSKWVWNRSPNRHTVYTEYPTRCTDDATVTARFYHDGDSTDVVDETPLWTFDETEFEPMGHLTTFDNFNEEKWLQTWGDLTYSAAPGTLTVTLPARSVSRLEWLSIPAHKNIRYRVIETVDESHSTGAHIGGRHNRDGSSKNSVETYLNSEGIGVSIFHDGEWSNPVNFPVEWSYGEAVEYTVHILNDSVTIEAGGETYEYSSDLIGSVPAGSFAVGSTGAGDYLIHEIEVTILD